MSYSSSNNPTYDNVPTAYWSNLEAFVAIFCVCMPALRRFLANLFPRCFGITQTGSGFEHYDTPDYPNRPSNRQHKNLTSRLTLEGTTFKGSGITKTTETRVESKRQEEDEVELVEFGIQRSLKEGWSSAESDGDTRRDDSRRGSPPIP